LNSARLEGCASRSAIYGARTANPFADYENLNSGNLDISELKTEDMLAGEYAREALKRGLALEASSVRTPINMSWGAPQTVTQLWRPERGQLLWQIGERRTLADSRAESDLGAFEGHKLVASGYTAVWGTENTR